MKKPGVIQIIFSFFEEYPVKNIPYVIKIYIFGIYAF